MQAKSYAKTPETPKSLIKPIILKDLHLYNFDQYRSNIRIKQYSALTKNYDQPTLFMPKFLKTSSKGPTKTLKLTLSGADHFSNKPLFRFLQAQSSLENLYITFTYPPSRSTWLKLVFILSKLTHLKSLHIHLTKLPKLAFDMISGLSRKFRKHPRLADFTLTDPSNSLCPMTLDLDKAGDSGIISARFISRVRRNISLTPRFSRLKTIRINTGKGLFITDNVLLGLDMAVTRLLHLEKISFNSGQCAFILYKELNKILDSIHKSKTLKRLKMGFVIKTAPEVGFPLDHDLWKAHPERIHDLTIGFSNTISMEILERTLQGIQGVTNLVGLCLDLRLCRSIDSEYIERICEVLKGLKGLKKLKVRLNEFKKISGGNVVKVIATVFELKGLEKIEILALGVTVESPVDDVSRALLRNIQGLEYSKRLRIIVRDGNKLPEEFCEEMMRVIKECRRLEEIEVDMKGLMIERERYMNEMSEWSEKLRRLKVLKIGINARSPGDKWEERQWVEDEGFTMELAKVLSGFRSMRKVEVSCDDAWGIAHGYLLSQISEVFLRAKIDAKMNSVRYSFD